MAFSWGSMLGAVPGSYNQAQQQQQQMADEEARRQLLIQQYQQDQRQAPLQDQLLKARIAHMQRPDINQQRYADERAATIQAAQFSGFPGAQPMPQPPQGGVPQAFQGAQPMPGVSPDMPQGQPQMPPQGQPQGQPGMSPGMAGMYQPQSPGAPQDQPPATPGAQSMPNADPIAQQEQQQYAMLQQRVQALPPARNQQEQYQRALAVQQAQQQIQARAQEMRKQATEQLAQRKQQETETWHEKTEKHWGDALGGQETRSQRSSMTSQRDTDMRGLDQARSSGMISEETYAAGKKEIEQKYDSSSQGGIPQATRSKLDAAVEQMHTPGEPIPTDAIGRVISIDGKQYKIVNNNGEVDYEPVK